MFYRRCLLTADRKNYVKAESTGWRAGFYYPGGGHYKGHWMKSEHDWYGVKTNKDGLVYDGQWLNGKRHGHGTMRQSLPNGFSKRIYIGEWKDDMKWGEGKQFYANGTYYGWWKKNRRHGLGVKWYKDGKTYVGEWDSNVKHGIGVYLYANGNRYEGHFARGFKNGEGSYYHVHTGQLQTGMWEDNVCKVSLVMDEMRHTADQPTPYPIPKCELAEPDIIVRELFRRYTDNGYKPSKSLNELNCLKFISKMRRFAKFEPKANSNSIIEIFDMHFPCVCRESEKMIRLLPV